MNFNDTFAEPSGRDLLLLKARATRSTVTPLACCPHKVDEHYTRDEDPERRCSMPDCPCNGLRRK